MDQGTLFLFLAAPVLEAGLLDLLMALCLGFLEGPFLCLTLAGLGCGLGLGLLLVVLLAALFQLGHGGREAKADLVEGAANALGGRLLGEFRPAGIGVRGVAAVEESLQPGHGRDVGHLVQGCCGVLHGGKLDHLRKRTPRQIGDVENHRTQKSCVWKPEMFVNENALRSISHYTKPR
ncbi:TPA: hypothetical protein KTX52_002673 [Enterococcus faecium]|nr:hypothetical protein [Enterococcus faecium]